MRQQGCGFCSMAEFRSTMVLTLWHDGSAYGPLLMKLAMVGVFCAKACVVAALAANGTILQSFPGGSGPGYKPVPDTTGAVGLNHVVDFEDSWFMVHEKATGKVLLQLTMSNFWMFVQPSNTLVLVKP